MANDLFGGLGGLMKGLTNLVPQDDPNIQAFTAQSEVSSLRSQESEIYAEIGKAVVAQQGPDAFGELGAKLKLIQMNLASAEGKLTTMKQQAEEAEKKAAAAAAALRCPSCGHDNPEGTKFCQECGTPMAPKGPSFCVSCGAELAAGTRFCGECGARQGA